MSLFPLFDDFYFQRPSRNLNQRLSALSLLDPEDILQPSASTPQVYMHFPDDYLQKLKAALAEPEHTPDTTISLDKDKFVANFDVQQFKPEEITVKISGENTVTIEGKHEEKQDEHRYISRHFVLRYVLPEGCDVNQMKSKLSSDGVLSITAPKIGEKKQEQFREIPIVRTGVPVKKIEKKTDEAEEKK